MNGGAVKKFGNDKFEQSHSAEKKWESLIVSKMWKGGPCCFGKTFYLMLEALDALKMKYQVHMVKVHNAQKVDRSR